MSSKTNPKTPTKFTGTEQDQLSHMMKGHKRLETNLIGGGPVLRSLKDDEMMRSISANRNTAKTLEKLRLISPGKGFDPLYGLAASPA